MTAHSSVLRDAMPNWPRLMSEPMAAMYVGIGKTTLREQGPEPKNIGRRIVYDRQDLDRWADALSGQPLDQTQREEEGSALEQRLGSRLNG